MPQPGAAAAYWPLPATAQRWLLGRARAALVAHLGRSGLAPPAEEAPLACQQHLACFVNLHGRAGDLRGSMGALERHEPLWRQVQQVAVASAVRDPRFAPLAWADLAQVVVEVICLTPPEPVTAALIRPGQDGVWLEQGGHRGVLLPTPSLVVGGPNKLQHYLGEACSRAGLDREAYRRPDVRLARFQTQIFSEAEWLH